MAVRLEFLTTDPEEIKLANRYWGMNEHGEFLEVLKDLVPFRELRQPAQLTKYVREICVAYDLNHLCKCGEPIRASGRTDLKKSAARCSRSCNECAQTAQREKDAQEAAEKAELNAHLANHIDWMKRRTISYQELPDDAVLILRALHASVGPRLWEGRFKHDECSNLAPYDCGSFVNRLYRLGVLGDDPEHAWKGTYFLEEGKVRIRLEYAHLFLSPDEDFGSGHEAFSLLLNREFTDADALSNLWFDYACADVTWYLMDQCDLHTQQIYPEDFVKIRDLIRNGLRTYSIAQMWFIMWKVARDAAALSRRNYYSQQSATATIPTKIRKQLELADKGGNLRDTWKRSSHHIVGTLGTVFDQIFGIDENTPGIRVLPMLEQRCRLMESDSTLDELAASFMEDTLKTNNSLPAMETFAEMIRSGLSTEEALIETLKSTQMTITSTNLPY